MLDISIINLFYKRITFLLINIEGFLPNKKNSGFLPDGEEGGRKGIRV